MWGGRRRVHADKMGETGLVDSVAFRVAALRGFWECHRLRFAGLTPEATTLRRAARATKSVTKAEWWRRPTLLNQHGID
jgi:hypothetical protein